MGRGQRIAKNTIFLYIRMLLVMGVTLYTSRVILAVLGVVDFGIFNVIAGMTLMFAFFQSSLSNVTQRFLNFEYGKGNITESRRIFNISALVYFYLSVATVVVAEIVGIWLIYSKLNIPPERLFAAMWTFQTVVVSLFFTLNGIVFTSVIIARENMRLYAFVGLFEACGRLLIAYLIGWAGVDKLILYSTLYALLSISLQVFYAFYCRRHYAECKYQYIWDKKLFMDMLKFAGWNGFGTAVYAINFQGINILLNIFFGPAINAAKAVASQVESAVNNFTTNFYTAVRPQIIKSYAAKDYGYFIKLLFFSSRYSFYLMLTLCIPIQFQIDTILEIWLKEPPDYTARFVHWVLIYSTVNVLTNPFWTAIQAVGQLKKYCLVGGVVFLSAFPISYVLLRQWPNPVLVFQVLAVVRLIYVFVTMSIVRRYIDFSIVAYVKKVVFPLVGVSLISVSICYWINSYLAEGIQSLIISCIAYPLITLLIVYGIGISTEERNFVHCKLKALFNRHD